MMSFRCWTELDAIGAIGIARAFAYGRGLYGREIHNPGIPPVQHGSFEAYKDRINQRRSITFEKLLLLRGPNEQRRRPGA